MVDLRIGSLVTDPGIPARLIAERFNRHTFWCGQSGSGKTYALGVVLEQLLISTALPIVVFDPNADFVKIAEVRQSDPDAATLASRNLRVLASGTADPLLIRMRSMSIASKAAMLRIDPLNDRAEYNAMLHVEELFNLDDPRGIDEQLFASADPVHHALAQRIENLGLMNWEIWAGNRPTASDIIAERPDATILNLSGFDYVDEPLVIALAVLEDLWNHREERRPVLLVIDEAHNLCSPDLTSPAAIAVRDLIGRIAAEGRKYGLWLLLSTQRPSKIHPAILSQCDNLALMKMNSPLDLDEIGKLFGYVPEALLRRSPGFLQGQALFAGGFIADASMLQMRDRITAEGGRDVPVPIRSV